MPGHRDIIAWQRAMDLAVAAYSLNHLLRSLKHADLASQLMRASLSVPSNIAEGNGRAAAREVARFLDFAMGSLREVETLLELTDRLALVKKATIDDLLRQADERVASSTAFGARNGMGTNSDVRIRRQTSRVPFDKDLAIT